MGLGCHLSAGSELLLESPRNIWVHTDVGTNADQSYVPGYECPDFIWEKVDLKCVVLSLPSKVWVGGGKWSVEGNAQLMEESGGDTFGLRVTEVCSQIYQARP